MSLIILKEFDHSLKNFDRSLKEFDHSLKEFDNSLLVGWLLNVPATG